MIDSFKSDTALAADIHLQLRPATDSMLAIGMMRLLIENDWVDHRFLEEHTIGFEALRDKVMTISLTEAEAVTGIGVGQLTEVTRLYAEHKPGLFEVGQGLQRILNGGRSAATSACSRRLLGRSASRVGVSSTRTTNGSSTTSANPSSGQRD